MQASILTFVMFYYNSLFMCLTPPVGCDCHLASLQLESCAWRSTPGWAVAWIPFFRPWAYHCHPTPALHGHPHPCTCSEAALAFLGVCPALVDILYAPLRGVGRHSLSISRVEVIPACTHSQKTVAWEDAKEIRGAGCFLFLLLLCSGVAPLHSPQPSWRWVGEAMYDQ